MVTAEFLTFLISLSPLGLSDKMQRNLILLRVIQYLYLLSAKLADLFVNMLAFALP